VGKKPNRLLGIYSYTC